MIARFSFPPQQEDATTLSGAASGHCGGDRFAYTSQRFTLVTRTVIDKNL